MFNIIFFSLLFLFSNNRVNDSLFQNEIDKLKSFAYFDSVYNHHINKIDFIIDKFNPSIDKRTRYLISNTIFNMSIKYDNLNIDIICATITHESGLTWNPMVVSKVGAMGLMQIMSYTGKKLSKEEYIKWTDNSLLFDPIINIRLGSRYLSKLIELYSVDGGLVAYNGGPKQAIRWLQSNRNNDVLVAETKLYVPFVLKYYNYFKNIEP